MAILVNPDELRIKIEVGDEDVIMIFETPSPEELSKFLKKRWKTGRGNKIKDESNEARITFADKHLKNIENVTYQDKTDLDEENKPKIKPLNNSIHGWKDMVLPTWKISASMTFEDTSAETERGNV